MRELLTIARDELRLVAATPLQSLIAYAALALIAAVAFGFLPSN
jgi:hypothetical protein